MAIAFGLPASAEQERIYGKTTRFDFQLNIYSKKFVVDAFAQQYNGLYIENPNELTTWNQEEFPQRDSMQTNSVGVAGFYVFNNKKLSYKAAYVRNAIQKILKLQNSYGSQQEILLKIDEASIDRSKSIWHP